MSKSDDVNDFKTFGPNQSPKEALFLRALTNRVKKMGCYGPSGEKFPGKAKLNNKDIAKLTELTQKLNNWVDAHSLTPTSTKKPIKKSKS